ncbi:DUF6327 family protein [Flavobacterium pedocola]
METIMYSSFEEIDRDLEILKLQKEIDYRKLSLSIERTVDGFTPSNIVMRFLGNLGMIANKYDLLQKIVLPYLLAKLARK